MRNITRQRIVAVTAVFAVLFLAAPTLNAQWVTGTVGAGSDPYALAVNPTTNMIYVVNNASNDVTAINGATNATSTIGVGNAPVAVAVNPETNTIYVTNSGSNSVTVINGATNTPSTVSVGFDP